MTNGKCLVTFENKGYVDHSSGALIVPSKSAATARQSTCVVPPGLILVEQLSLGDPEELHADERRIVDRAVQKRQQEFSAGRACAREALVLLGIDDFPLLANSDRSPRWPQGIVGSITHTHGYYAAIVGRAAEFASVGLDAEVVGGIKEGMWHRLFTEKEQAWLATLVQPQKTFMATMLFSAKESFFKYQYPMTRSWLEFTEVEVAVGEGESIEVNALEPKVPKALGHYSCVQGPNVALTVLSSRVKENETGGPIG